jgi:hypothetical protein
MAKKTKDDLKLITQQIISALYSAYTSLPKGSSKVSIPLSSGHYSGTPYSYRVVQQVYKYLCDLGWIEIKKGNEYKKKVTRIWAIGELSNAFDNLGLIWMPQEPNPEKELVILRNYENPESKTKKGKGKKIDLSVPETPEVHQYRSNLYHYNNFLLKHCVSLDLDDENLNTLTLEMINKSKEDKEVWETEEERVSCLDLRSLQLRRIFSRGSLEKGGRFYGGFWISIPSLYRPHIRIDGYQTFEMDYSSMALRIIYAREGIKISENDDLYDIGLSNYNDQRRKIIKTYVNAILNDEWGNYSLSKKKQSSLGVSHKELHELVLQRHKPISHLFNSGVGLDAQFIDSQIAEEVMLSLLHEEVLVLPIHDSFIVRAGYADWLREDMKRVFKKFTNSDVALTIDRSRENEHFGLSDDEFSKATKSSRVIPFSSEETWEAFSRTETMDEYLRSWKVYRWS